MKKWTLVGIFLILGLALAACSNSKADDASKSVDYKTVQVMITEKKLADETLEYSGIIKPDVQKNLSFKIAGRLHELFVNEGDYVEAGQMLGSIDTQDVNMQLNSLNSQSSATAKEIEKAKEAFTYAESQYENAKVLYEEGAVSKVSLDSTKLAYEQARLNHEIAQDNSSRLLSEKARIGNSINEGTIYADQSGLVTSILYQKSEYVSPGQTVFIIGSNEQKIEIHVTRQDRKLLSVGQKIYFMIDDEKKEGEVTFVDDMADLQTSTYKVEIAIEEEEVLTGSIVRVEAVVGQTEGIWIPIQCIQSTTIDFVYVIEDGKSSKRSINILEIKGDQALVDGLEVNESLIVAGMKSLVEGMPVKAQELEK